MNAVLLSYSWLTLPRYIEIEGEKESERECVRERVREKEKERERERERKKLDCPEKTFQRQTL